LYSLKDDDGVSLVLYKVLGSQHLQGTHMAV